MKAVVLPAFDEALRVDQVELPTPGPGEVRVRVAAAAVNGFDLSVAKGMLNGAMEHRFPVVLGKDFAGTVDEVGAGVDGFAIGDRVFGVVTKDFLGDGSFGEYVTVPVAVGIATLPESVGFVEGAALGLAGTAAVQAVDAAGIAEGATVVVVGATGGVGQQALQLAVAAGATVIATASTDAEIAKVTELGAAHTVDYTGDVAAQIRALAPAGVDAVLHFAGDPAPYASLVRPGGVFASTMLRSPQDVPANDLRVEAVYANPTPETLTRLAANQAGHHTSVTVERVYPLDQAADAFADFTSGTLGKLVFSL